MSNKLELVRGIARSKNISNKIYESDRKDKKYYLLLKDGKKVYFGAKGYKDYLDYKKIDKKLADQRRECYRTRHSNIYLKNGKRAIDVKNSAAYLSYNLLW